MCFTIAGSEPRGHSDLARFEVGSPGFEQVVELLRKQGAPIIDLNRSNGIRCIRVGRFIEFEKEDLKLAKYFTVNPMKERLEAFPEAWHQRRIESIGKPKKSVKLGNHNMTNWVCMASKEFMDLMTAEGFTGFTWREVGVKKKPATGFEPSFLMEATTTALPTATGYLVDKGAFVERYEDVPDTSRCHPAPGYSPAPYIYEDTDLEGISLDFTVTHETFGSSAGDRIRIPIMSRKLVTWLEKQKVKLKAMPLVSVSEIEACRKGSLDEFLDSRPD